MGILNLNDLFITEFTELATINGVANVPAIATAIKPDTQEREYGLDVRLEMALIVRATVAAARNNLVTFRGSTYRIEDVETDSDNSTKRILLSKRNGSPR